MSSTAFLESPSDKPQGVVVTLPSPTKSLYSFSFLLTRTAVLLVWGGAASGIIVPVLMGGYGVTFDDAAAAMAVFITMSYLVVRAALFGVQCFIRSIDQERIKQADDKPLGRAMLPVMVGLSIIIVLTLIVLSLLCSIIAFSTQSLNMPWASVLALHISAGLGVTIGVLVAICFVYMVLLVMQRNSGHVWSEYHLLLGALGRDVHATFRLS